MRIGFRAFVVALLSPFLAIACLGGENQCLNPQPDLPSCRSSSTPGTSFGGAFGVAGAPPGTNGSSSAGSTSAAGSGSAIVDGDAGPAEAEGGASTGDFAGAGGDAALPPVVVDGGAGGAAGSETVR